MKNNPQPDFAQLGVIESGHYSRIVLHNLLQTEAKCTTSLTQMIMSSDVL